MKRWQTSLREFIRNSFCVRCGQIFNIEYVSDAPFCDDCMPYEHIYFRIWWETDENERQENDVLLDQVTIIGDRLDALIDAVELIE